MRSRVVRIFDYTSATLVLVCGIACASSPDAPSPAPAERAPPTKEQLPPPSDAHPLLKSEPPAQRVGPIPTSSKQLVLTLSTGWNESKATLYRFARDEGGDWTPVDNPFEATLGRTGLGWGRGLHDTPSPPQGPMKIEGDGKSPAGIFAVGALYGYAPTFDGSTNLPYQQVDTTWQCVDDSKSQHYNRVLSREEVEVDWTKSEEMRRRDELYRLVVAIDHNSIFAGEPVPEGGSCIFFHVWRRPGAPTIGCTAMPLAKMKTLASWLDPADEPVLVALPQQQYERLKPLWHLPPIEPR